MEFNAVADLGWLKKYLSSRQMKRDGFSCIWPAFPNMFVAVCSPLLQPDLYFPVILIKW